jgi:cytochrome b561
MSKENLERIEMTTDQLTAEGCVVSTGAEGARFDQTSIALHWFTVLLVVAQFASAWLHEAIDHETSFAMVLLTMHRTTGGLTWIVAVARLVWRRYFAHLPPFPPSMPKLQQSIAKANEYGLYALLLLQPITGLGNVLFHGRPFSLLIWEVPALLESNPAIRGLFVRAHEFGARALVVLIGLHAGAALFHGLVSRDGVLQRMLPWTPH